MDTNQDPFKKENENTNVPVRGLLQAGTNDGYGNEDHGIKDGGNQVVDSIEGPADHTMNQASYPDSSHLSGFTNSNEFAPLPVSDYFSGQGLQDWPTLGTTTNQDAHYEGLDGLPAPKAPQNFEGLEADSFFNHQDDLGVSFNAINNPNHHWTPVNVAPRLTMKTFGGSDQLDQNSGFGQASHPPQYQNMFQSTYPFEDQASGSSQATYHSSDLGTSSVAGQVADDLAQQFPNQVGPRGPGRPRGGCLPPSELANRIPEQFRKPIATPSSSNIGSVTGFSFGQQDVGGHHSLVPNLGSGLTPTETNTGKKKRASRAAVPKPAAAAARDSTPFMQKHPTMTAAQLKKVEDHNLRVMNKRTESERVRNNMSAKRGRYKRMAITIAIADEVLRLRIEVQRAHEELYRERVANGRLVKQLETAGVHVPPLNPSPTSAGTVGRCNADHDMLNLSHAMQQELYGASTGYNEKLHSIGRVYGPDVNGKYHLPSDHLALDEVWAAKAEETRRELIEDLKTDKIALLEGGCAEQMISVITRGDEIRALQAKAGDENEDEEDAVGDVQQVAIPKSHKRKAKTPVVEEEYNSEVGGYQDTRPRRKSARLDDQQ
jgi:hypothetical protein